VPATAGNWKLETGNWKLETGNWKLETGLQICRTADRISWIVRSQPVNARDTFEISSTVAAFAIDRDEVDRFFRKDVA
jgi:hypothetical protein